MSAQIPNLQEILQQIEQNRNNPIALNYINSKLLTNILAFQSGASLDNNSDEIPFKVILANNLTALTTAAFGPTGEGLLLFSYAIPAQYTHVKLWAFSISGDSNFQSGYTWKVSGLPQDWNQVGTNNSTVASNQNTYQYLDKSTGVFDFCKAGVPIPLKPNTTLNFYTVNSNSASNNGNVSLYVILELR